MFFFNDSKKGLALLTPISNGLARQMSVLIFLMCSGIMTASSLDHTEPLTRSWSSFVPIEWQEDIIMPVINTSLVVVSKGPASSGIPGNTDVVLRYTIKNSSTAIDTLDCLQINFDIAGQIGIPPFLALTGSLSAMTGSGNVFGAPIPIGDDVYGGLVNPFYNGNGNDSLFSTTPNLRPGECLAIDIPIELGDTTTTEAIFVDATATGKAHADGAPYAQQTMPPTRLIDPCESESLACAGKVNVSVGTDCIAVITLSTVFLNLTPDPNRYTVLVYDGNILLGDTLRKEHIGKVLTYSVIDACFDNQANCWGEINVENKNIPRPTSTYQEIFCGEDPITLPPLEDIIETIEENTCFVALSNYQETYSSDVDKCDGGLLRRVVTADYEIDGWKIRDTVHVDSLVELALVIDTIMPPIGGPDVSDAVYVNCDSLDGNYPTPEFIKDYFNSLPAYTGTGVSYAYPWIDRGTIEMEMYTTKDTIFETRRRDTLEVNGLPIVVTIVEKDTVTITDTTTITKPYRVPVKTGTVCNFTTNYSDVYFPGCTGPEGKILRTWKLLNFCNGDLTEFEQWIIIDDDRGPDIEMPDTLSIGITPWTCHASIQLTAEVSDNCSPVRTYNWRSTAGVLDSNNVLSNLEPRDSPVYVTLQAVDDCGNDSLRTMVLFVIDSIAPVAIGKDQVNTTITYDPLNERGIAKVTAASIDAGSHDSNCGPVTLCVLLDEELSKPILRANGTQARDSLGNLIYEAAQCDYDGIYEGIPYVYCKEAVKFCCDMVGEHRVALLAHDESPTSFAGISWTLVNVEDKSFPIVSCSPITIRCGDDISPDSLGYPESSGGFCNDVSLTYFDVSDLNDCGAGVINRIWLNDADTACIQRITVIGSDHFDPYSVKWPKHYDDQRVTGVIRSCVSDTIREEIDFIEMGSSFDCGEESVDQPVWCETSCALIFTSYEDLDVEASDACKKIVRTWTLIDWCNYSPNSSNAELDDDQFEAVSDEEIDAPHINTQLKDGDLCESCDKPSSPTGGEIFFRYTNVDLDGFYTYKQVIKVVDHTAPIVDAPEEVTFEVTGGATSKDDDFEGCETSGIVSAIALDLCGDLLLDASSVRWNIDILDEDSIIIDSKVVFGDSISIQVTGVANNDQIIRWTITDGCDNQATGYTLVIFHDIIDPTPLCIRDLSIATMNDADGTATIWASDYNQGSFDNCSDVKYFFKNEEGFVTSSLTFTCADIPDGQSTIKNVELFVTDEAGNSSICNISIMINDNNDICVDSAVGSADITGQVATALGDMIEAARVTLNGRDNEMTNVMGTYAFSNIPMASSYKIQGNKNNDHLNGVSTLDLLLIQRHILGLGIFDSPYKVIAADVTNDQKISAIDLVQMRRLILGMIESFPNNESWRFIDPTQEFSSITSPWPLKEEILIESLQQNMTEQNLLGIKIGDVNGTAIANSLMAENRNAATIKLSMDDQFVKKGQFVKIPVQLENRTSLSGLQFTVQSYDAKIVGIHSGALTIEKDQYAILNDQTLTMAWHDLDSRNVSGTLIEISIVAERDMPIHDAISITSEITPAKAYLDDYESLDVSLSFLKENGEESLSGIFELMQNEPNPFSDVTNIGFVIPERGIVKITFTDIAGRAIYIHEDNYDSGYNEIKLSKDQLSARGVIYYHLSTAGHTDTRKMILLD